MNYFITTFTGKHPIQLNDFEHLQQAYLEGFDALCKTLLPDGTTSAILNGCELEVDEDTMTFSVSEGFIYHEGEIYFLPGAEGDFADGQLPYVAIVETYADFNPVEYKDGQLRNVHQIRIVAFSFEDEEYAGYTDFLNIERCEDLFLEKLGLSESTEQIVVLEEDMETAQENIAGLQDRLDTVETDIIDLMDRLDSAEDEIIDLMDKLDTAQTDISDLQGRLDELEPIAAVLSGNPILMIDADSIDYFGLDGLGTDMWDGWALCDGRNLTPDLRGKFVAGYDPDNAEYDLEAEGGEEKVILDETQMPVHAHEFEQHLEDRRYQEDNDGETLVKLTTETTDTASAGGLLVDADNEIYETQPHENRPPYYVLAFVKKIS